jgi:hypothetical protein
MKVHAMTIPGFSANNTLYTSGRSYRMGRPAGGSGSPAVLPQLAR